MGGKRGYLHADIFVYTPITSKAQDTRKRLHVPQDFKQHTLPTTSFFVSAV